MNKVKTIFPLFFFIILFLSCSEEVNEIPTINNPVPPDLFTPSGEYSYLALGDSYTIGQGVIENESFPVQLNNELTSEGFDMKTVKIIARTGWRTTSLISAIDDEDLTETYDLVTLLIGVNDQYTGGTAEHFRPHFKQVLQTAITLTGNKKNRVIVLSIPDYGVTPYGSGFDRIKIANEIDSFNKVKEEEADKAGVNYLDITEISRKALNDPSLIATDNLHPSGEMYRLWTEIILDKAVLVLQN